MTMPELWGWVETLLVQLGVWDLLTSALTIIVVISLGMFALKVIRGSG